MQNDPVRTGQSDCAANASDPFCITENQLGWAQGYCSEHCVGAANDCAGDALCVPVTDTASLCSDGCSTDADCRMGYGCADVGTGTVCVAF